MNASERLRGYFSSGRHPEMPEDRPVPLPEEKDVGREMPVREFTLPRDVENSLSEEQKKMLALFRRVGRRIGDLYLLQKDKSMDFYPEKVSKAELESQGEENPELLSGYTYVRRDAEGKLIAIPIHEVFKDQIQEKGIARSLYDTANLASKGKNRDNYLQGYLRARAEAFQKGKWEISEKLWLQAPLPDVFMLAGPYDTYLDKRGKKYAWQSWVDVLDKKKTAEAQEYTDKFLSVLVSESTGQKPNVRVRVGHTVMMSGQAFDYEWTGNSMPCQKELRDEYGSVFFIFEPVFNEKLEQDRLPVFRSVIDHSKRAGTTDEQVADANFKRYLGHETVHHIIPADISSRLGGATSWVKELFCDLKSIEKGSEIGENKREKDLLFSTYFANGVLEHGAYEEGRKREEYYVGNSIVLNYCLKNGSITTNEGIINWTDSKEVMNCINNLSAKVENITFSGTEEEAIELAREYFDSNVYKNVKREVKVPEFLLKRPSRNK